MMRLRFVLIVLFAGVIVGQWPTYAGTERWRLEQAFAVAVGTVSAAREYFCPMDPGVISVWPAICPICNMDLVPRRKMDAQFLPDGVLARMQLSPYRIQLAGIKTSVVESRPLSREHTCSGRVRELTTARLASNARGPKSMSRRYTPRMAEFRSRTSSESFSGNVQLIADAHPSRARFVLDPGQALIAASIVTASVCIPVSESANPLVVPETAVVDHGDERIVFVESMPGMFDAVAVEVGRRCGSMYPVSKGLTAGQRVASAGAFLIDAETR